MLFYEIVGERNSRMFRGLERDPLDVGSLVDFMFFFGL